MANKRTSADIQESSESSSDPWEDNVIPLVKLWKLFQFKQNEVHNLTPKWRTKYPSMDYNSSKGMGTHPVKLEVVSNWVKTTAIAW